MELLAVYEDAKFIYQVFEFFKGESLYSLIESGLILDEVQMASVHHLFIVDDLLTLTTLEVS